MFWNFKKQLWLVTNSGKCKFTDIRQNVCHNRVSEWLLFKWAIYHLDIMPRTSYVLMRWWWWWWWCWCLFCTRLTRVGFTIMLDHWSSSQHVDMSLKIQRVVFRLIRWGLKSTIYHTRSITPRDKYAPSNVHGSSSYLIFKK